MKKLLPAIGLLIAAARASAQLVYEPFNYSSSILDGQLNPGNALPWSKMVDPDNEDDILINNSNLGWSGLSPATGKSVTYSADGSSERLSLGHEFTSGTLYYSLIFQVTSPLTTTAAFIGGFSDASGESQNEPQRVGTRLYLRQGPNSTVQVPTFSVGVSKNSSAANDIVYNGEFPLNTPVLVVGSYAIVGTTLGTDDVAKLWVNPSASDFGTAAAPAATLTAPLAGSDLPNSAATGPQVAGFVLRQATPFVPAVQVDELRIDRTWAQVTPPVGISWNFNGGGVWSEDGKWSTLARPNDAGAFVNFGAVAAGSATISVDGGYALRTINFAGGGPYTLNGAGTLNFSSSAAINVLSGSHIISTAINMGGDFEASVRSGSSLTLSSVASNSNSLIKAGAGTLQLSTARFNNLEIVGGTVKIAPSGSPLATVSKVNALTLSSNATLDLTNNDMVIDYVGASPLGTWNGAAYTGILGAIQSGRNSGAWNGKGIITSQTNATGSPPRTTLGVAEASTVLGLSGGVTTTWRGQTVDATSLLIKYTYTGDANLDGRIDADDYFVIDRNYGKSGVLFGYGNGDFDYSGTIDSDDFFIIDTTFAAQGPQLGAPVLGGAGAVPEPAGVIFIWVAAVGVVGRRRRCG